MTKIFVSCERIDAAFPQGLIRALEREGATVVTSPRNPLDGKDARWSSWYEEGLIQALGEVDCFLALVNDSWDSSTWMGQESALAEHLSQRGQLPLRFHVDLRSTSSLAAGMAHYLVQEAPSDLGELVKFLRERRVLGR